jgi:hypothetical protein
MIATHLLQLHRHRRRPAPPNSNMFGYSGGKATHATHSIRAAVSPAGPDTWRAPVTNFVRRFYSDPNWPCPFVPQGRQRMCMWSLIRGGGNHHHVCSMSVFVCPVAVWLWTWNKWWENQTQWQCARSSGVYPHRLQTREMLPKICLGFLNPRQVI